MGDGDKWGENKNREVKKDRELTICFHSPDPPSLPLFKISSPLFFLILPFFLLSSLDSTQC